MTGRIEIRQAVAGTRRIVVCDGVTADARCIEAGVGAARAAEMAARWGRLLGLEVVDVTGREAVTELEMRRGGGGFNKKRSSGTRMPGATARRKVKAGACT